MYYVRSSVSIKQLLLLLLVCIDAHVVNKPGVQPLLQFQILVYRAYGQCHFQLAIISVFFEVEYANLTVD